LAIRIKIKTEIIFTRK